MKLLIIRHGDPDYEKDSLTEKGWKEAEYLSERLLKQNINCIYVSSMGRAKDTAKPLLEKTGYTAKQCDWLKEFNYLINRPDVTDRKKIPWDWLPQDWLKDERFFSKDDWFKNERMTAGSLKEHYDYVVQKFDKVLEDHGYVRTGEGYTVKAANTDTLAFFCHYGVQCVLLSHLLNVSPMVLWHGVCAAPSSVTTIVTEERRKGIASFRMSSFGDISHLYFHGELPSAAARFCEIFDNQDERHD